LVELISYIDLQRSASRKFTLPIHELSIVFGFTVFFLPVTTELGLSRAATSLAFSLARAQGSFASPLILMQAAAEDAQRRNDADHAPAVVKAAESFPDAVHEVEGFQKNELGRSRGAGGDGSSDYFPKCKFRVSAVHYLFCVTCARHHFAPTQPALETSIT
jgi:hypothetical protein